MQIIGNIRRKARRIRVNSAGKKVGAMGIKHSHRGLKILFLGEHSQKAEHCLMA